MLMDPNRMVKKVPFARCSNHNCGEELDTHKKLMAHMAMGISHAPSFYAVKTGVLKKEIRDIVITKFKNFLEPLGLWPEVYPTAEAGSIAFVVGAVVTTSRTARRGAPPAYMSTAEICDDAIFESDEAAMIALALECQGGAIYIELRNENVAVPTFLPELSTAELYEFDA